MTYVIVVLETASDVPGVAAVFGPYDSYEAAVLARTGIARHARDQELVQVSSVIAPATVPVTVITDEGVRFGVLTSDVHGDIIQLDKEQEA